jgi:hypothetical protein
MRIMKKRIIVFHKKVQKKVQHNYRAATAGGAGETTRQRSDSGALKPDKKKKNRSRSRENSNLKIGERDSVSSAGSEKSKNKKSKKDKKDKKERGPFDGSDAGNKETDQSVDHERLSESVNSQMFYANNMDFGKK